MSDDREPTQWVSPGTPEPEPVEPDRPFNPYAAGSPYTASAYGRFPGQQPVLPPPSQAMAGWALGLSLVPCVITVPLGVIFAIVTLVRSTAQRNFGKGKAIAALCIAGLWVLVFIGLVIAGVAEELTNDADRNEAGEIEDAGELSVFDLETGDCWMVPDGKAILEVQAVPCEVRHELEVYWAGEVSASDSASMNEIERIAVDKCIATFKPFVGIGYGPSELEIFYVSPTMQSWEAGDREVTCSIFETLGGDYTRKQMVTGTLRGADR